MKLFCWAWWSPENEYNLEVIVEASSLMEARERFDAIKDQLNIPQSVIGTAVNCTETGTSLSTLIQQYNWDSTDQPPDDTIAHVWRCVMNLDDGRVLYCYV